MEKRILCYSPQCINKPSAKSINLATGFYICHRCGDKGRDKSKKTILALPKQQKDLEPPPEFYPLSERERHYLIKTRNLLPTVIDLLPIYRTAKGILFLFPNSDYWQERRWAAFSPPKYMNPSGDKAGVTYNVFFKPKHSYVVLVEGVMDALAVSQFANASALLGKELQEQQILSLLTLGVRDILILLDADVVKKANLVSLASEFFRSVIVKQLREKDPASISKKELRKYVLNKQ